MIFKFISKLFQPTKMVLIVRTDLRMGQGKIASQCAHAAVSLFESANIILVKSWLRTGQPKIVLRVDRNCEKEMNRIYKVAKESGLNVCKIFDAGRTQVESGTLTVLGIGPNLVQEIDQVTKHLRLL